MLSDGAQHYERWRAGGDGHRRAVERAEASVVRTVLASSEADWELLRPLVIARDGRSVTARVLKGPPRRWSGAVEYGYDKRDRIVLARRFRDLHDGGRAVSDERVLTELDGTTFQLLYFSSGGELELAAVVEAEYHDERLTRTTTYRDPQRDEPDSVETYDYDDQGRLVGIHTQFSHFVIEPDDDGAPLTIRTHLQGTPPDQAWVVYRRAIKGEAVAARKLVERRLPQLILAWAAGRHVEDDIYGLGISYELEALAGGPNLGLGSFRELDAWRAAGAPLADTIWNPAEFGLIDTSPQEIAADPETMGALQTLAQAWGSTDDREALRKMMVKVAKSIAAAGVDVPSGPLEHPVVWATDYEQEDLERNLKASVPKATRRMLEST